MIGLTRDGVHGGVAKPRAQSLDELSACFAVLVCSREKIAFPGCERRDLFRDEADRLLMLMTSTHLRSGG